MSNPKHPTKMVIAVRGGLVDAIFTDKPMNVRIFVADYDDDGDRSHPSFGRDHKGQGRFLREETAMLDTAAVRNIINKRGGEDCDCGRPHCPICSRLDPSKL